MKAIIAGPDGDGLGDALTGEGIDTIHLGTPVTGDDLAGAGIGDADLFILTDIADASTIPVAKEQNPGVRVVVYTHDALPEFARGQTDLAVDPDLLAPNIVAEELSAS